MFYGFLLSSFFELLVILKLQMCQIDLRSLQKLITFLETSLLVTSFIFRTGFKVVSIVKGYSF